ncbi:hypothetical protein BKA61DRAFT_207155 [Leptodontidium sp. MPI-SDFR-AT-0119]|nr:hypothetical protein BKA61DRAFT_207155 [Leptodontidium sp. MPI-SDFR-AT-0119]
MPPKPKEMAANHKGQKTPAPKKEQPYECRLPECSKRFRRKTDAARHYNHLHDRTSEAHCPVCLKMISSAREDKQKKHMAEQHPDTNQHQPWMKISAPVQPVSSAAYTSHPYSMVPAAYDTFQPSESNGALYGNSSVNAQGKPLPAYNKQMF